MSRAFGPLGVALASGLIASALSGDAAAQSVDAKACGAAYVKAQLLRRQSQLRASRSELLVCSNPSCASSLRGDCAKWLSEVETTMPTVVFAVKSGDGRDLIDVNVMVDGEVLVDHVGGTAIPVDPGSHTFRFSTAGLAPVDVHALVREGERARTIEASFASTAGLGAKPAYLTYAAAGGALFLLGFGTAFEAMGLSDKGAVASCAAAPASCSRATYDSDKSVAQRGFVAGDVFLGLGLVAAGAAVYLYVTGAPKREASPTPAVVVLPSGVALRVRF